jgi:FxsC-like protein
VAGKLGLEAKELPRDIALYTKALEVRKLAAHKGGETLAELEELLWEQQETETGGDTRPAYWLYFSCSEKERKEDACQRFFVDLTKRLRAHLDANKQSIGGEVRFFDERNVEAPDQWFPWALRAISHCRVLVCLVSKAYFQDEYCGQIWTAFLARLKDYQERERLSAPPPLIIPVLWKPTVELSSFLLPVVARDPAFPMLVPKVSDQKDGLYALLQMASRDRDGSRGVYEGVVDELAQRIAELTLKHALPAGASVPPLKEILSSFYRFADAAAPECQKGVDVARFVVVAGRKAEMMNVRGGDGAGVYDDEPEGWRPYYPPEAERFRRTSGREADKLEMTAYFVPLGPGIEETIKKYEANGNVILGLVDPWTLELDVYVGYTAACYRKLLEIGAILLCWNSDSETTSARDTLTRHIFERVFSEDVTSRYRDRFYDSVSSLSELRTELGKALLAARNAIVARTSRPRVARGRVYDRPKGLGGDGPAQETRNRETVNVRRAEGSGGQVRRPEIEGPC